MISLKEEQLALNAFTSLLQCKERPFGGKSQRTGLSDGIEGVQWNCVIDRVLNEIRLGVNLEGMIYNKKWLIADFIENEMTDSLVMKLSKSLPSEQSIYTRMARDAWQVSSRPKIEEGFIGGQDMTLAELSESLWRNVLDEAYGCLDSKMNHRGRAKQNVTLIKKGDKPNEIKEMQVTPHLNISTLLWRSSPVDELTARLIMAEKLKLLMPVYEAVKQQSMS